MVVVVLVVVVVASSLFLSHSLTLSFSLPGAGCGYVVQQNSTHHSVPTRVVVVVFFLSLSISFYPCLSRTSTRPSLVVVLVVVVVVAFSLVLKYKVCNCRQFMVSDVSKCVTVVNLCCLKVQSV